MDSMQTNMLHLMGLDETMKMVTKNVFSSLPDAPVSLHAPLAFAAAARPPRDGVDRTGALPVGILCDILSRLPARDAALTSALSTRWRRLWRSVPLVLADAHLKHTGPPPPPVSEIDQVDGLGGVLRRAVDGTRDVASAVSRALAAHPGALPQRPRHVHPHGCAPRRARALAPAPRRQGRPGARLGPPGVQARRRRAPPGHALQVQLPHLPLHRLPEVPGRRHHPARRRLPPPPRARPLLPRHGCAGPRLAARQMPRPGEPRDRRPPGASAPPRRQP
ncbi:Os06g0492800 [Oryza sativa Japonica Group]|uniref:Os06g0492800 protein n=1 Tax=Oryza sativa subsp. japonica TaxID=39947 RepID=C7J371_ORYSJ|nr:Os06g0492800 [Oryza sativa Japonica Group]|eukprot:NP_001174802.1 Os06g0492800 [Oryza sativa Japonica Group]